MGILAVGIQVIGCALVCVGRERTAAQRCANVGGAMKQRQEDDRSAAPIIAVLVQSQA